MEQKIDKKNSYPFGITSSTTVHVIGEVVAIGGILYYTHSQVNQLNTKIASLEKQILDLTNILKHLSPHSFLQSPTTQSPQSTPTITTVHNNLLSVCPKRANSNLHIHQLHKKIFTLLINKQ